MVDEFRCPYCDRSCTSQSGLTLHSKKCPSKSGTETEMEDYDSPKPKDDYRDTDPRCSGSTDYRDTDPRGQANTESSSRPSRPHTSAKPKSDSNGPFNVGAFLIFGEHIPIMLDLNFASALADHILKHGSENRAILAFGHQLSKASGDD